MFLVIILLASSVTAYDISYDKKAETIRYSYYYGDVHKLVVYNRNNNYRASYNKAYVNGYNNGFDSGYRIGSRNSYYTRDFGYNSYKYGSSYKYRFYSDAKRINYKSYYDDPKYRDRYYF